MRQPEVILAVDAENLFGCLNGNGKLDYKALLNFARSLGILSRAMVYTSIDPGVASGNDNRKFLIALKMMGFDQVVARPRRQQPDGKVKSPIDVIMAMDLWEAASRKKLDILVLATGDSDFVPLVERLVDHGIKVYVVGPDQATAWELIVASTRFLKASEIEGLVQAQGKMEEPPHERPQSLIRMEMPMPLQKSPLELAA